MRFGTQRLRLMGYMTQTLKLLGFKTLAYLGRPSLWEISAGCPKHNQHTEPSQGSMGPGHPQPQKWATRTGLACRPT